MSDLKIWKAICGIKYPAAAALFDRRGDIAARWRSKFDLTDWRIAPSEVTLLNSTAGTPRFQVGHRGTVCVMELPKRYREFRDYAFDVLCDTLETLDVGKLERVGLRLLLLAERRSFKALLTRMRRELYRISDEAWSPLGGLPIDIGFPLTLRIGDCKANFTMGPMEKEQLEGYFDSVAVKEKLPATALFVDFDLYMEEPDFRPKDFKKELSQFLDLGESEVVSRSKRFIEQFGGFER